MEFEANAIKAELDMEIEEVLCEVLSDWESEDQSSDDETDSSDTSLSSLRSSSASSLSSLTSISSAASTDSQLSTSDGERMSDISEPEDLLQSMEDMIPLVLSQRYLLERITKAKSRHFVNTILPQLDDEDFKEQYRMFPSSFSIIAARIKTHPVFDAGGLRRQEPAEFQLRVALKRFSTEGSSASGLSVISKHFGIGKGTVNLYTDRVTTALMSLWDEVVSWKSDDEKRQMRERLVKKGFEVFERCVGIVDGTLIVLKEKPALDRIASMAYFNYRKQKYGFQATVVCDDEGRILKFSSHFLGAVHDARAWKRVGLASLEIT